MKQHLVVIKLGGGLITDKTIPLTTRPQFIELFASELKSLRENHKNTGFLVGNGAGSFGHFAAHKYGLRQGAKDANQFYGMCLAHNGVHQLNNLVVASLNNKNIPAFAASPSLLFTSRNSEINTQHLEPILHLLGNNCVPVLHGDTICDSILGTKVFSTEQALMACIQVLKNHYKKITVIYLLVTNGVLDKNGKTIAQLKPTDQIFIHSDLRHDVTGGITGKITSARQAAALVDSVYLLDGTVPNQMQQALTSGAVGTIVR